MREREEISDASKHWLTEREKQLKNILPEIDHWFLAKSAEMETFARNDTRLEGWFKGEMLVLLDQLKRKRTISDYEQEFNFYHGKKRYQVDFKIKMESEKHLVELKAPCISQARGTPRNLNFYFREDNIGLLKDFRKLNLTDNPNRWLVAFIYPKPAKHAWQVAMTKIPRDFSNWQCVTKLDQYPDYLFISLWKG